VSRLGGQLVELADDHLVQQAPVADVLAEHEEHERQLVSPVPADEKTRLFETFGLPRKGRLEVGADADFVVFDPSATYRIDAADNASRADYSVYDGREVTGRVVETWVRGERVAADGRIVADPGHGAYLHREVPDWGPRGGRA
jgi:formylmethanofuran dehydrogenase subunit A